MELLNQELAARLIQQHVDVQIQDPDTLILRNLPVDRKSFNKPATNLLLARPQDGMPFLVCVDQDLVYSGTDRLLVRAFASAQRKQGWRVLDLSHAFRDLDEALRFALAALGFDLGGSAPRLGPPAMPGHGGLLVRFGTDLTRTVMSSTVGPTVGREEEIERITASVCGWQARLCVIEGEPGIGKTNLLQGVARRLAGHRPGSRVIAVNLGVLVAAALCEPEREGTLSALLGEAGEDSRGVVLGMEHVDTAFLRVPGGALILEQALENGLHLVGTALPRTIPKAAAGVLSSRLDFVRLQELGAAETIGILRLLSERIAQHHGVRIDASVVGPAVERAASVAGCFPSKAISLLDSAAARAALMGAPEVELVHVFLAGADLPGIDPKLPVP